MMMDVANTNAKVSIIMPVLNGDCFIGEAIQSVINQTYLDWELLIIDDNSTDNTLLKINAYTDAEAKIDVISLSNGMGTAKARNLGIAKATGRYIAFLDADDVWLPAKLETQLAAMQLNKSPFCFTAYEQMDVNGAHIKALGVPRSVSYFDLLKTNVIGCSTAMYDTKYFGKVAMPDMEKRQDFALWLQLLKSTEHSLGINTVLARYRKHSQSLSSKKLNAVRYTWSLFREVEQLTLLQCVYYFSHYAVRGFIRNSLPRMALFCGMIIKAKGAH